MRKRFEQQIQIGQLLIEDTEISKKCRHSLVELMAALKVIFTNTEYNEKGIQYFRRGFVQKQTKNRKKRNEFMAIICLVSGKVVF